MNRDEELAREALAPFLNEGNRPFKVIYFGPGLSITIDTLVIRVTEAIAAGRAQGKRDAEDIEIEERREFDHE